MKKITKKKIISNLERTANAEISGRHGRKFQKQGVCSLYLEDFTSDSKSLSHLYPSNVHFRWKKFPWKNLPIGKFWWTKAGRYFQPKLTNVSCRVTWKILEINMNICIYSRTFLDSKLEKSSIKTKQIHIQILPALEKTSNKTKQMSTFLEKISIKRRQMFTFFWKKFPFFMNKKKLQDFS